MINQNWVFGTRARLNFATSTPTATATAAISTWEGCASISDAAGTLVMYTDGFNVWDGSGALRATNLQGNASSTQSAIIVPDPGNAARYYPFTADGWTGANKHVNGVRIDTSPSTWTVTLLSTLMTMPSTLGYSPTEKITAIQHANCRDFWVVTVIQSTVVLNPLGLGTFRVFLVNSAGVQHVGDTPFDREVHDVGYLKASSDGKRIALANWSNSNVLTCPFDNSTGTFDLSNLISITFPPRQGNDECTYGLEFSPNCNLLYCSVIGSSTANSVPASDGYIFQYNFLTAATPVQVGIHKNIGGRYSLGALQLGPDGRIYIAQDSEPALGIIANPDVPGAGCNLAFSALSLAAGSMCYMGLPNLIPNPCPCPCEADGNCDAAVDKANQTLNGRADRKSFTIVANGQTVPTTCDLAFPQANIQPVFTLHWGDGPSDQFEDEDTEVIYIRVYNPFRDLKMRGLKIFNIAISPNQVLPNGENSLQLIPAEIDCFDDIGPCSHVSRDFALLIKSAIPQGYKITFDYCIEEMVIVTAGNGSAAFGINVVAS